MKNSLILLAAILIGILTPQLSIFAPIISYLLGVMLFFSFLKTKISFNIFTEKKIYFIFFANIFIGICAYFALIPFHKDLAFIAFFIGITPTALAAPAVMSVLKGKVEFVIATVLVTNFGIAFLLPFISSFFSPIEIQISEMVIKILLLLGIPFTLSQIVQNFFPLLTQKIQKKSGIIFYIWGSLIIIAIAKASLFLRENWTEYSDIIVPIFIVSALLCLLNFIIGYHIGGKQFSAEASQSLGQKNPMLMIWVALEFFTPLVALGPISYILFHNLVNAYKMAKVK